MSDANTSTLAQATAAQYQRAGRMRDPFEAVKVEFLLRAT